MSPTAVHQRFGVNFHRRWKPRTPRSSATVAKSKPTHLIYHVPLMLNHQIDGCCALDRCCPYEEEEAVVAMPYLMPPCGCSVD
uniref:Uncharacterized protein n=1 Tax=Oryza sativa subsp. japonica TaxID=39947 RepID=Q69IP0_ORYSJ|nr:unknown protein [Oryza sativa Japonica Group]